MSHFLQRLAHSFRRRPVEVNTDPASGKVYGLWEPCAYGVQAHPEELAAMLRRQQRVFRDATDMQVYEAIMRGQLPQVPILTGPMVWNKVTNKLLEDNFAARLVGAQSVDEDMRIRYLAAGTNYAQADSSHTGLQREIIRKAPLSVAQDGKYAKLLLFLDFAEANGASTTIAVGTNTKGTITVTSAAAFNIGDAIRVSTTPQQSFSRIINKVGNVLTLDSAEELLTVPTDGMAVLLCIGETGTIANANAVVTLNGAGDLFSRSRLRWPKTVAQAMMLRHSLFGEAA